MIVRFSGNADRLNVKVKSTRSLVGAFILLTVLTLVSPLKALTCPNPPSPKQILLYENTLSIIELSDVCKVKYLNITVIYNNITKTFVHEYNKETVNAVITLPKKTPITLTIKYSNYGNKVGSLRWTISYLPYTTYTLEKMTSALSGTVLRYYVLVNPPPNKPLLPREFGDPKVQSSIIVVAIAASSLVGLIKLLRGD